MEIVIKIWVACIPDDLTLEGYFASEREFYKLRRTVDEWMC
jgi:hypothetical protein